jgi:hypothetical protein
MSNRVTLSRYLALLCEGETPPDLNPASAARYGLEDRRLYCGQSVPARHLNRPVLSLFNGTVSEVGL